MARLPLSLALTSLALLSCAADKNQPVVAAAPQVIERPNMSWGLPFEFKPIRQAEPSLQEAGKAVALIRFAEGGSGTGFFISENGLFLTNEHIISRDSCLKSRCAGIQIIRDFRPGGALELFEEFEILAQSKDLDTALIKVKLPADKKVPFLKLSLRNNYSNEEPLVILGHPGGASLHISASRLEKKSDPQSALFRSVSTGGNSGSPILDPKTLEVMAIHSGSVREKKISRKGVAYGYGTGILSLNFEKMLKTLDPSFSLASPSFSLPAGRPLNPKEELLAPSTIAPAPITLDLFARTAVGTENEKESLLKLLQITSQKVFSGQNFSELFDALISLDLNRGKKLALTEEELKAFLPAGEEWPMSVKSFYLGKAKTECFSSLSELGSVTKFAFAAVDCFSLTQAKGEDSLEFLARIFDSLKDETWGEEYESTNNVLLMGIEGNMLLRPSLSAEETKTLQKTLAKIGSDAPIMAQYFRADRMLTLLTEKPELLGPGSFRGL